MRLAPSIDIKIYERGRPRGHGPTHPRSAAASPAAAAPGPQSRCSHRSADEWRRPLESYALLSIVDQKRLKCLKLATTYAYDYIHIFELAVKAAWERRQGRRLRRPPPPSERVRAVELVLRGRDASSRSKTARPPGTNKVGMVAWLMTLCTPEYPKGREIVLIANDITFANGTFGPLEDRVFERASQFARARAASRASTSAPTRARASASPIR